MKVLLGYYSKIRRADVGELRGIMREIVEKLSKIEAEQSRRQRQDYLAAYNAGEVKHEKQLAFHKCLKRNRWVFGGKSFGEDGVRRGGMRVHGKGDSSVSRK